MIAVNIRLKSIDAGTARSRAALLALLCGAASHPKILVLSRDGRRLFAANWSSRDVTEIDTHDASVVRTLAAEENPRGMALTSDGRLYIANFNSQSIDVYEGAQMQTHRRMQ